MNWKEINHIYQISDTGLVRRKERVCVDSLGRHKKIPELLLQPRPTKTGYLRVQINYKDYYIHRLVAQAFIPNPLHKSEVNHIDGNKSNNCVSNLEWVTKQENCYHASVNNLINKDSVIRKNQCRENQKRATATNSKPVLQCGIDGKIIQVYPSIAEASRITNIPACTIGGVCRGDKYRKTAGGFIWQFKNIE